MSFVKQAKQSVGWTFIKQISVQGVNFIVQLILARLLAPSDFGIIAMILVFIAIGQSLMDSGMTSSLIREKDVGDEDFSTVFLSNVGISIIIYIVIFIIAPYISIFYQQPILTNLLRAFSLSFVIGSFNAVQLAKLTRELNFKSQFFYQLPSVLISAVIGILCAYHGYGVWSLVYLNLTQVFAFAVFTWVFSDWKPKLVFDKQLFKKHFNFGYKLTLSGLIDTLYQNLYKIIIGKYFNPTAVGFFSQADNLRLFPINQISLVLDKVTYPLFSKIGNDKKLKEVFISLQQLVLSFSSVIMIVLVLIAKPLFYLLLGEKWMPAVHFFQILCVASIFRPIGTYNLNILKIKGRSDLFLKLEIIKKIIGVSVLIFSISKGIDGLVWGLCLTNIFFAYFNGYYSGKLIGYKMLSQFKDTGFTLLLSLLPIIPCLYLQRFLSANYQIILFIPFFYFLQYVIVTYLFNKTLLIQIRKILK